MIMLKFESTLPISRELAWQWITDADALRAEIEKLGFEVKDTADGSSLVARG